MSDPAKLIQDLQEFGIVKGGGPDTRTPQYPTSKVVVRALDPQDAQDVEDAFQAAQEALLSLGEALLRSGPPSTSGAAERLAYIRQQLSNMERDLGLTESVENRHDYVTDAHVMVQKAQGVLFDVQTMLRERGESSD